jgi:class 3 adenylate cyclase/Flp pilus assembly protein TadD/TolB-like protein
MVKQSNTPARRSSTIMYTDIVGFSKKLEENETRAIELLKTHDALIRVLTAKFDGKVIKSLGDSFIVEFPVSIKAIKCAIEIQKRFWNFNRGKSEFDTIQIRAGLHFGDIIIRNEDAFGEGVTIASRIEALTEPNRISITKEVFEEVKNDPSLHVFKLGAMELRDISRFVEVYEVLIESIPELSQPSSSAQKASMEQQIAAAEKREKEELNEAVRIEETRHRLLSDKVAAEEDRNKKIYKHYLKAEKYFEAGELELAEKELAEIAKLDPHHIAPIEKQHQIREEDIIIQGHLDKAKALIKLRDLETAEKEVNEIFRFQPLHVGAQQLLMQIEEERYLYEERSRTNYSDTQKRVSEEDQKVNNLLEQARNLLREEKYNEATYILHELFLLDPNNSSARRLEESIRGSEQAKKELLRLQGEVRPNKERLLELARLQSKVEEQKHKKVILPAKVNREPAYKKLNYVAVIIIVLLAAYYGVPRVIDIIIPRTASLAVLRFTNAPRDTSDSDLLDALPVLLAEDFARCENLTVVAPSSSLLYIPETAQLKKIASLLPVQYLLIGTIQENHGRYSILIRLLIPEEQKIAFVGTVEGRFSDLSEMRKSILQKVLEKMEIKSALPNITQPASSNAFLKYLKGIRLLLSNSKEKTEAAKTLFLSSIKIDPKFGPAYGALAKINFHEFQTSGDSIVLNSAIDYAQKALRCSPDIISAYSVLATYYRLSREYDSALFSVTKGLDNSPQNPECLREATQLSIIAGKYDEATSFASYALIRDPKNAESQFIYGLVHHFKREYAVAESAYYRVQELELQDSILTTNFLLNAWTGTEKYSKVIQYCQRMLNIAPDDYRYHYWIGRAYQLSYNITTGQTWLEEGLTLIKRILEENPNDAIANAYAGLINSRLGKFSDGEYAMNKAMQIDSTSSTILYLNADLYSMQKNKQKAFTSLERALQREYKFEELLNPDLSFISYEPEFITKVSQKVEGIWPILTKQSNITINIP